MRLLTPSELREVEKVRGHIFKDMSFILRTYEGDEMTYEIDSDDDSGLREMWLNVLDMVLQTQDAMSKAWRNAYEAKGNE